jgi:hypothetical protein
VIFERLADPDAAPYLIATAAVLPLLLLRGTAERMRALALSVPLVVAAIVAEGSVFLATGYLIRA